MAIDLRVGRSQSLSGLFFFNEVVQLQGAEPRIVVCHVSTSRCCCLKTPGLLELGYVKENVAI